MTESEQQALRDTVLAFAEYFYVEMRWEYFRSEFISSQGSPDERTHVANARKIARFLERHAERHPVIRELLEEARSR